MRSGPVASGSPGSSSMSRQRRSGAAGASALQCASGERREREPERRPPLVLVAGGRGAQRGEAGLELDARAQQQHVALEGRQRRTRRHERLERRRALAASGASSADRRRRCGAVEQRGDAIELRGQRPLVARRGRVTASPAARSRSSGRVDVERAVGAVDLDADEVRPGNDVGRANVDRRPCRPGAAGATNV